MTYRTNAARRSADAEAHRLRMRLHVQRQQAHTLAIEAMSHLEKLPEEPDDYLSDIRRGRRWIFGGLFRWLETMILLLNTPKPIMDKIAPMVQERIDALYEAREKWSREDETIHHLTPHTPRRAA